MRCRPTGRGRSRGYSPGNKCKPIRKVIDGGLIEGSRHAPDLNVEPWITDELIVACAPERRWFLDELSQASGVELMGRVVPNQNSDGLSLAG
jgi:hypothetical protein